MRGFNWTLPLISSDGLLSRLSSKMDGRKDKALQDGAGIIRFEQGLTRGLNANVDVSSHLRNLPPPVEGRVRSGFKLKTVGGNTFEVPQDWHRGRRTMFSAKKDLFLNQITRDRVVDGRTIAVPTGRLIRDRNHKPVPGHYIDARQHEHVLKKPIRWPLAAVFYVPGKLTGQDFFRGDNNAGHVLPRVSGTYSAFSKEARALRKQERAAKAERLASRKLRKKNSRDGVHPPAPASSNGSYAQLADQQRDWAGQFNLLNDDDLVEHVKRNSINDI